VRRVLVIGAGGSGKTTFARALAAQRNLPLIHLDALYWSAGWTPTPNEEWDRIVAELIARDTWVMDGNYGRTLAPRLAACDCVIFLDFSRYVCLWRVFRRWLAYRGRSRPDLAEGCPESLTWEFIWWIWTYPRRRRPEILRRLAELPKSTRVVILRSREAVRRYLQQANRHSA
jgi:adenylate kinase family enzyme